MEEFRPVLQEDYPGCYEVSNMGRVKYLRTGRVGFGIVNKDGYFYITAKVGTKRQTKLVHRLVAEAFIPNPDNKRCINHLDGDKQNNDVINLEWCTHSENMKHAVSTGLVTNCTKAGQDHNASKYSDNDIAAIRALWRYGGNSMRKIAKAYGCSVGYVSDVVNNKIR